MREHNPPILHFYKSSRKLNFKLNCRKNPLFHMYILDNANTLMQYITL